MDNLAKQALEIAKNIQRDVPRFKIPPSKGNSSLSEMVFPQSLVKNTRGYLERVTHQINGTYANGYYDACAVMLRRLIETLIIEAFEYYKIESKIKNPQGDYLYLGELVTMALNETSWTFGREAKRALPRLKDIGNRSAHNRRFIAHREDIEKHIPDIRIIVQEFIFLANLQKL